LAILKEARSGRLSVLEPDHVVGRAPDCKLLLDVLYVSSRHAEVRWTGEAWELRDLGSHNGTFFDGSRVPPGEVRVLKEGNRLAFGRPDQEWHVIDVRAPQPMVVALGEGSQVTLEGDVIGLPSEEQPTATLFRGPDGRWLLERAELPSTFVDNGAVFHVDGRAFRFSYPDVMLRTATTDLFVELSQARLCFSVSRDEEYVELVVELGPRRLDLGSRTHHYVLLTLARARIRDAEQGLPDTSCGWVYLEDLTRDLAMQPTQLNLEIFRIRQTLSAFDVLGAATIIERRSRTRQLRIGARDFEIRVL
jgi:hypothetical protein